MRSESKIFFLSLILLSFVAFSSIAIAQFQNPFKAAKQAWEKSRQQAKQQEEQQKQQEQNQQSTNMRSSSAADGTSSTHAATQGSAAPWTPPDVATAAPVKLDPAKMPDVVGVHLGMTAAQAVAAMHKTYPTDIYQQLPFGNWPDDPNARIGYNILSSAPGNSPDAYLSFTAPLGPQLLWHLKRITYHININHATLLAALRAKYGKETVATTGNGGLIVKDDPQIAMLFWLFNEKGERVPLPPSTALPNGRLYDCWPSGIQTTLMPYDDSFESKFPGWCSTMVMLRISIGGTEIVQNMWTDLADVPLAIRTAHAANIFLAKVAAQRRQEAIQKSKQVKPVL